MRHKLHMILMDDSEITKEFNSKKMAIDWLAEHPEHQMQTCTISPVINTICPVCNERPPAESHRVDSNGLKWCQECTDEHDSIDWESVYEGRRE